MSKQPPAVEQEAEAAEEPSKEGETMQMVKQLAAARTRWSPTRKQLGVGAAIGVGSAAVVAALLYWRGNKK
ncbi:MAG: hypothetical protein ACAH11_11815 [Sphingomonas sp.]